MKSVELAGRTKSPHLVGLTIGQAPGLGGVEHPHLLTYDPCKVGLYKALWSQKDLTVCNSPWIWGHHSLYIIYALVLMLILGFTSFPDTERGSGPACSATNLGQNAKMCQLDTVLQESKTEFRFLIAFLLAGYVAATVRMWGVRRQNYASLCGNARNLNIQIASFLPVDGVDAEVVASRETLARWVMLAFELAMLKASPLRTLRMLHTLLLTLFTLRTLHYSHSLRPPLLRLRLR